MNRGQQLRLSGPFPPEAMLGVNQYAIICKVFHYVTMYDVLQYLACNTGQGNWSIVTLAALLEDAADICLPSLFW